MSGSTERSRRGFATRAIHRPPLPEQDGDPLAPPLDLSSTYAFEDTDAFAKASAERVGAGYVYTRWANPTVDAFEAAVADLEGAEDAEAFSSGMAAIWCTFMALCRPGDRIVAARQLYGGAYSLLSSRVADFGITVDFFDVDDLAGIEAALPGAAMLYCETIGNPRIVVADLPALGRAARGAGVPLVVDNTFASPALCRPVEHGATLVVHSATKFLGGHHDLVGGIACGDPATVDRLREVARDTGPTLAPFNAWLALRGMATLPLRVERSSASALAAAEMLTAHDAIERVDYPALPDDPSHSLCRALLGGRGGGTIGFVVAGGRERAGRFQEALDVVMPAASLGGIHSLVVHAASITHTQLSAEELRAVGMDEGFCRLSVGLEDPEDIVGDLAQALDSIA
ncbi:MAG TPA: aminotransferase class I/II-fold pyridoxal phosphate-dependent enzyme [Actinomycetota bacterium]|nr:aminotransferase class I/II-fold pyridoxal phosphate-dependent enzyme [Actinomycetota bacterium]